MLELCRKILGLEIFFVKRFATLKKVLIFECEILWHYVTFTDGSNWNCMTCFIVGSIFNDVTKHIPKKYPFALPYLSLDVWRHIWMTL